MITIRANNSIETLRALAVEWGADFTEGYGISKLELDNEWGKGSVCSYDIFPGLAAFAYDITFFKEVHFQKDESEMNPLYFFYCLEGYAYHRFNDEINSDKISQMQNIAVASTRDKQNIMVLPAHLPLKLSVILIMRDRFQLNEDQREMRILETTLFDATSILVDDESYKHFGEINLNIAQYAKVVIENKRTDIVGRLLSESAVINTITSQLNVLQKNSENSGKLSPLNDTELDKLISLGGYIANNIATKLTIEELAKESGLQPKKLQAGTRFLYGKSLNHFIRDIKLEYAKDLIQSTDLSISEVVYSIGLNSRSYFSRIFQERFGVLPNNFKNSFVESDTLFELSYRSTTNDKTGSKDIEDIIKHSRAYNKRSDITGCLVSYDTMFFQLLEGPKLAVLKLYEKIKNDERHHDINVLWKGTKISRLFGDWSLATFLNSGHYQFKVDGMVKHIDIKSLQGNIKEPSIQADILWRRIRNILKTTPKI